MDGTVIWAVTGAYARPVLIEVIADKVVRRLRVSKGAISSIAAADGRVWILQTIPGDKDAIACVTGSGTAARVAVVPRGMLGLVATRHSVWTLDYRHHRALAVTF